MNLDKAAERLSSWIKAIPTDDPLLRKIAAEEFFRSKGYDISTLAGCKAALIWLETAQVSDAFWEGGAIDNATDWYIGEARLEALSKALQARLVTIQNGVTGEGNNSSLKR